MKLKYLSIQIYVENLSVEESPFLPKGLNDQGIVWTDWQ